MSLLYYLLDGHSSRKLSLLADADISKHHGYQRIWRADGKGGGTLQVKVDAKLELEAEVKSMYHHTSVAQ